MLCIFIAKVFSEIVHNFTMNKPPGMYLGRKQKVNVCVRKGLIM